MLTLGSVVGCWEGESCDDGAVYLRLMKVCLSSGLVGMELRGEGERRFFAMFSVFILWIWLLFFRS